MDTNFNAQKKLRSAWYNMLMRHRGVGRGRGRDVCGGWLSSFDAFAEQVGLPPSPEFVLCLRVPEAGFQPGNVFWGTRRDRQQYVAHAAVLEYGGRRLSICGWACELGVLPETIRRRLRDGWPLSRVLSDRRWPSSSVPRSAPSSRSSSRFVGVSYRASDVSWEAKIRVHRELYYLGVYYDERDAAEAVRLGRALIQDCRRKRWAPSSIRERIAEEIISRPKTMHPERRAKREQTPVMDR